MHSGRVLLGVPVGLLEFAVHQVHAERKYNISFCWAMIPMHGETALSDPCSCFDCETY